MAFSKFTLAVVLTLFAISSALDMSIVNYDERHGIMGLSHLRTNDELMAMYESWLVEHGNNYNDDVIGEKEWRFEIFKDNVRFIDQHNYGHGRSYEVGLNRFADLTNEEFRSMFLGGRMDINTRLMKRQKSDRYAFHAGDDNMPESVDWREKGAVPPVKDQGHCGCCWAFSTIGAVEGINKIVTGDLITLSEQELVDCDGRYNKGCSGRFMDYAFDFIVKNGGVDTEEDYPYDASRSSCDKKTKNARAVSIDGYEDVPENDEMSLMKAVAHQPVSVAIDAGSRAFQLYQSGVFTGTCGTQLDHGAVVVGYGRENGLDYWIVRNSWGLQWGESGYIKLERNLKGTKTGKCGIAMEASYPLKTE